MTAVRYIVNKLSGAEFGLTYIGDMPRFFLEQKFLGAQIHPLDTSKAGDIVFFYGYSRLKVSMVRHVGCILDAEGNFFHSTWGKGGVEESLKEKYMKKVATKEQLLTSKDPRNIYNAVSLTSSQGRKKDQ